MVIISVKVRKHAIRETCIRDKDVDPYFKVLREANKNLYFSLCTKTSMQKGISNRANFIANFEKIKRELQKGEGRLGQDKIFAQSHLGSY